MSETAITMKINSLEIGDHVPVRIMGVLNASRESFYQGSYVAPDKIGVRAGDMLTAGADMLDVGARSTAPKSAPISVDQEVERVSLALESLFNTLDLGQTPVSVDTQFRVVAEAAYRVFEKHGKSNCFVVNDVSCLCADRSLAPWVGEVRCPVVLMAAHERPGDSLGVGQTLADIRRGVETLERYGKTTGECTVIDPAIGRWIPQKTTQHDLVILDCLEQFRCFQLPILVGLSRKSFVGELLRQQDPGARLYGTLSATAIAVYNGAHIVRTHDVSRETTDVVQVASALRRARLQSRE